MKTCFDCQASVPDESEYCVNCGRIFGSSTARSKQGPLPTTPYQGQSIRNSPTVQSRRSLLLWLIVGVCGVAVMGLMLIVGLQPRSVVESVGRSETSSPPTAASPQSWSTPVSIEPPRPAPTPVSPAAAIDPSRVYTGREVSEKARLLSKPEPSYTETARQNRVWGTVVLKVVFSASGSVENISVVSGLPDGLTESAIDAARKIRFIPAKKDGVPVSMWMQLEYNFNLY